MLYDDQTSILRIGGLQIRPETRGRAMRGFAQLLSGDHAVLVATINPEMIVSASDNARFRAVLNGAAMHLIDGIGLVIFAWLFHRVRLRRFTGADAVVALCGIASVREDGVFLLGTGSGTTLLSAAKALRAVHPALRIAGTHPGLPLKVKNGDLIFDDTQSAEICSAITRSGARMVIIAFGHVKQELWFEMNKGRLRGVRIGMGVGGALDYLGGSVRRAPGWMRSAGLEWLYRLLREPRRIMRIMRALVVFPLLCLRVRRRLR